jgi:phage-related protein
VELEEFRALPLDMQAYFFRVCHLIEDFGLENVGMSHIKPLRNKLHEIRLRGRDGTARAIYLAKESKVTILRVMKKKTRDVPNSEIELALNRLREGWNEKEHQRQKRIPRFSGQSRIQEGI